MLTKSKIVEILDENISDSAFEQLRRNGCFKLECGYGCEMYNMKYGVIDKMGYHLTCRHLCSIFEVSENVPIEEAMKEMFQEYGKIRIYGYLGKIFGKLD